jgi:Tfp pilus assembly protein FimT
MLPVALRFRPFSYWPVAVHISLACVLVLLVFGVTKTLASKERRQLAGSKTQLAALVKQARSDALAESNISVQAAPDFTQSLPNRNVADDVVRDMGRNAATIGVNLGAVTVVHQDASARELGKVQFTVTANAEYGRAKTWLAELLARYTSLAVQTLSVRASAGEGSRQDWQLVFTLYVKG